jgi:2-methylisocitrate lyase-like PEP mutase family enzyme
MVDMTTIAAARQAFRDLHTTGTFVLPNAWDVGSARLLAAVGFAAVATTSSGHAAALGRPDQRVRLPELLALVESMTSVLEVPVSVDAERCFGDSPEEVARAVRMLADAGASGVSIEDYDPAPDRIDPVELATDRVAAAVEAAHASGIVVTARAENHLYLSRADRPGLLDDTIGRLSGYATAGADVVYAPGLTDLDEIARLVAAVAAPVNVLALPGGPAVPELAAVGVRRVSIGGGLAWAAYGAMVDAARELAGPGTVGFLDRALARDLRARALS